jgi:DNA adenine methylase
MQIARPFLKWVGGKSQLLGQFEKYYPDSLKEGRIENYVEPFLGGGAMFFAISAEYKIKRAYLSDSNRDLILSYLVVQQKPEILLDFLHQYQDTFDKTKQDNRYDLFLSIRAHFNQQRFEINYQRLSDNWISRAAQFIFLNKTCFNGLFRLNSKGEFNVPFGKYKTAAICDEKNITAASDILQKANIFYSDYSSCYKYANEKSFIYLDPPYRPISKTSSFTTYTGMEFLDEKQLELAAFFRKLDKKRKAKLMLSNSDPTSVNPGDTFFEKAYPGYNISRVFACRAVNCRGFGRGKISELLITNYGEVK